MCSYFHSLLKYINNKIVPKLVEIFEQHHGTLKKEGEGEGEREGSSSNSSNSTGISVSREILEKVRPWAKFRVEYVYFL